MGELLFNKLFEDYKAIVLRADENNPIAIGFFDKMKHNYKLKGIPVFEEISKGYKMYGFGIAREPVESIFFYLPRIKSTVERTV